ncbi:MAG: hemolysin [Rickettsiaceae bacterium]|jgi:membrane fusion protein (multidrug efflux system)|nr:hemolysin [Rickettsiaceae bacterium]
MSFIRKTLKRLLIITAACLMVIFFFQSIFNEWLTTESTDNAFIDGDISLISPEVSGVIKNIAVTENSEVSKGDIIIEIEDADYRARFEQSKAQLQVGENAIYVTDYNIKLESLNLQKLNDSLSVVQADLSVAEKEYKRNISLNKEHFSSAKLLDNAKANLEKASFALKKAKLDIESSEYNISLLSLKKANEMANLVNLSETVKLAERAFNNSLVKAPVDGIVTNLSAKVGNYATPGRPLFAIVHIEKLSIKANFKETQIKKMKPGMPVVIKVDVLGAQKLKGQIRSLAPATGSKFSLLPIDNTTGNFTKVVQRIPVTIDFELPEVYKGLLIPGMSVKAYVHID